MYNQHKFDVWDISLSLDSTEKDLLLEQIETLETQLQETEACLDEAKSSLSKQEQSLREWETIAGEGTSVHVHLIIWWTL